jgi:ATP-dependent DNA helicase RecG
MALDMNRIEAGENLTTEFKREYSEEIKKTIVAFANTAGGTLYIGVNDDKTIIGVTAPDDTLLQITNAVRSAIKPDITLFVDYKTEKKGKATVIAVTVQKGTACPYYLAGKGIRPEGVYIRQGSSSVPASETAILNMIKETDGEKYEEVRSLNQDLTFNTTKQFFGMENIPFGLNQQKSLRLQTTDGVYTNLGLLLSDQSLHTIKLAVFEGLEKEIFKDRREMSGSLLKQLNETYEYLDIYNRTHAEVKGLVRLEKRDYPEDALREALLNALVHRDYSFSSSTLISIFDDRIEFVSIGGLPKGVSLDDILLGLSVPRNENLANVFYRLRLIEVYGTGIPKIMRSYNGYVRKPELQATGNAFKITLPNRNTSSRNVTGNEASFTENEEKVIALLDKQGEIVRKDVEANLTVSQAMAVRILRGLVDKEIIRAIGGGKKTRYRKAYT